MAEDNDKLRFSSNWDIDQIIDSGTSTFTATAGASSGTLVTHNLGYPPVLFMQYRIDGQGTWHEPSYLNTFIGSPGLNAVEQVSCHPEITNTACTIHFNNGGSSKTVYVRWWILEDRIT